MKTSGSKKLVITISVGRRLNFDFCKNGSLELNSTPLSSEKIFKTGDEFLVTDKIAEKTSTPETLKIFGNVLMKIVVDWNSHFNSDLQEKLNTGEEDSLDLSKNGPSNK